MISTVLRVDIVESLPVGRLLVLLGVVGGLVGGGLGCTQGELTRPGQCQGEDGEVCKQQGEGEVGDTKGDEETSADDTGSPPRDGATDTKQRGEDAAGGCSPGCDDGQMCREGECVTRCSKHIDCRAGQRCEGGWCTPGTCQASVTNPCPCKYKGKSQGVCATGTDSGSGNCAKPMTYQEPEKDSCDGKDNDCDGVVDEGCECDYMGKSEGICAKGLQLQSGKCEKPQKYAADEQMSCDQTDNDCDGVVDEGCACNFNGTPAGVCSGGTKKPSGKCEAPPGYESQEQSCDGKDNDCDGQVDEPSPGSGLECKAGDQEMQSCGSCGQRVRTCTQSCTWGSWGSCQSRGVCTPGQTETGNCGKCGQRTRRCTQSCSWGAWGSCTGQGVCSPGQTTSQGCGACRAKECTSSCTWSNKCTECTCSQISQCGYSCPNGYHVNGRYRDLGCGGSGIGDNAVRCGPNCGSFFTACGRRCPSGYRRTSRFRDLSCGGSGIDDNAVRCQIN